MKRLTLSLSFLVFLSIASCRDDDTPQCTAACDDRQCGDDGCGGVCGTCGDDEVCNEDFTCEAACEPSCEGAECGDDGCGGVCGTCGDDEVCNEDHQCEVVCEPSCEGAECGDDGCGGVCGNCSDDEMCNEDLQCEVVCEPSCEDACCGDDGCGGTCPDTCDYESLCDPETCACIAQPTCGDPVTFPICENSTEAPENESEIIDFIAENALTLKCETDEEEWTISPILADFEDTMVFFFGEMHYTNELGPISAAIFSDLVRRGEVNTLALEFGMDATQPMQDYVQTGDATLHFDYYLDVYPPSMFIPLLVETARELFLEGYEITIAGVDTPERMDWINDEIEEMAEDMSDESSDLLLETMPDAPDGAMTEASPEFVEEARAYFDFVTENLDAICAELDDDDCERVEILARSLWLVALLSSSLFDTLGWQGREEYFSTREPVIYFNFRRLMESDEIRVFAHMGAFHTAQSSELHMTSPVASFLQNDFSATMGRVYSTAPAWGDSEIGWEGYMTEHVDPYPEFVTDALEDRENDTWFVSARHPSELCQDNPLLDLESMLVYAPTGQAYNALIFVRNLSPMSYSWRRSIPAEFEQLLRRQYREREAEHRLQHSFRP